MERLAGSRFSSAGTAVLRHALYRYFIRNDQRITLALGRCHLNALQRFQEIVNSSTACHFDAPCCLSGSRIVHDIVALILTEWRYGAESLRRKCLKIKELELVLASRRWEPAVLYYFKKRAAKYFRANYHHGDVLDPETRFLRGVSPMSALGISSAQASLGSLINDGFKNILVTPYQVIIPVCDPLNV